MIKKLILASLIFLAAATASAMRVSKFQMVGSPITITSANVFLGPNQLQQDYAYSIQAIWTGSELLGTVELMATIDGINWSVIPGSPQAVSGPGSFVWNVNGAFYDQVEVYFVYTSGSGGMTVWEETKGP